MNDKKQNCYVFLYDDFADFEISLALYVLQHKYNIITFSVQKEPCFSHGKIKHIVDKTVNEVDVEDIAVLLIPGGNPEPYKDETDLHDLINQISEKNLPIAAICGGPGFLAHAGILEGKKITHGYSKEEGEKVFADSIITEEDVVIDSNIISAKGWAYAEFAVEVGKYLHILESENEAIRTLQVFKNQKPT